MQETLVFLSTGKGKMGLTALSRKSWNPVNSVPMPKCSFMLPWEDRKEGRMWGISSETSLILLQDEGSSFTA